MKNKRILIILIIIIIAIIGIIIIRKPKGKQNSETTIENNIAKENVEVEEVTFSEIKKTYESGITTLSAKMTNNSNKTKNFTVKITLTDDNGKVPQSLTQVVDNLEKGQSKILSTGIIGDYSKINNVKFELVNK